MDTTVEKFEHAGLKVKIKYDNDPPNPRTDWDPFGKLICFHRRYDLGDKHDYRPEDYNGWDELEAAIAKDNPGAIILPLYLYDHSVLHIKVGSFVGQAPHAEWDSGRVGFAVASAAAIRENYLRLRITPKLREQAEKLLRGEVETYDQFLSGQCYGYVIKDQDGEELDSCWGIYGLDYAIQEAKAAAEYEARHIAEQAEKDAAAERQAEIDKARAEAERKLAYHNARYNAAVEKDKRTTARIFNSPYEQYRNRNGQTCYYVRAIEHADPQHDAEVLPLYIIRFDDGTEIEAWPEEIHPAIG